MKWLAILYGGEGPDVWDKEVTLNASEFMDAAQQAAAKADELGGYVSSIELCD